MKSLGIDIGTTTISAAVLEDGCFITSETCENNTFLAPTLPGERIQDAQLILDTALRTADMLFERYPDIERIGVTGQMHGILYLDGEGNAVSPLYTWQDARGDAPCEKSTDMQSWTAYLCSKTGLAAATGYGLVTHAYNLAHGLVPTDAVTLCTIGDYIAMKLCGRQTPVMDASNAAGLGFFDAEKRAFNQTVLRGIGIDPAFLPGLTEDRFIGICRSRARVAAAIGDNQASFLSAVRDREHEMLVNVGTGSQFSVFSSRCMTAPGLETRPMPSGDGCSPERRSAAAEPMRCSRTSSRRQRA
ncbi:MAG: FGGY family carbohydrate kinase [Butyricicoccaceae bacterium]